MSALADGAKPSKHVYVYTVEDGVQQKYKLVVKGELRQLGTRKMKRYLAKATGVPEGQQRLFFGAEEVQEDWNGEEIGLFDGAELFMDVVLPTTRHTRLGSQTSLQGSHPRDSSRGCTESAGRSNSSSTSGGQTGTDARHSTVSLPAPEESAATNRCLTFPDDPPAPSPTGKGSMERSQRRSGKSSDSVAAPSQSRSSTTQSEVASSAAQSWQRSNSGRFSGVSASTSAVGGEGSAIPRPGAAPRNCSYSRGASVATTREQENHLQRQRFAGCSDSARSSPSRAERSSNVLSTRPSTSLSSRPSTSTGSQQRDPRLSLLAAENDAMHRENNLLRQKLLQVERRAVKSTPDQHLLEQIEELQDALLEKEAETEEAVRAAEERSRVKEEELVRELDLLREERRRLRREQTAIAEEQRATVDALQAQLRAQRAELSERDELIQQLRANLASYQSRQKLESPLSSLSSLRKVGGSPQGLGTPGGPALSLQAMVQASLERLSIVFNAGDLELDDSNTCILQVDTDDLTSDDTVSLLITLDNATERLYMYSTVLSELPDNPSSRLRLYERLLEGSLLGKDMAGAGVGVSKEDGLVLMSTSVDVRRSDPSALAATARAFVAAVKEWTTEVRRLLLSPQQAS